MLADQSPSEAPRICDHQQAQQFIRDWVRAHCYRMGHVSEPGVSFHQRVSSCTVKILYPHDSRQGPVAANTMFTYDLARGVTEGQLRNLCLASVEPIEAWPEQDSRWKGKVHV